MKIARRLVHAGGALVMAAMLGSCDDSPTNIPDGGADLRVPDQTVTPTLTVAEPSSASNAGGVMVKLTGTNFKSGATVTVGGIAATQVAVSSATELSFVVPAKAATCGPVAIVVKNPDGSMATNDTLFKYRPSALAFAASQPLAVGMNPRSVIAADVDGDGNLDLLTANSGSANISILSGQGNGSFGTVNNVDVDNGSPFAVVVVDLNNDQKMDLVSVHRQGNFVKVRLGMGGGAFMKPTTDQFSVGAAPYDLAAGKLNNDGNIDVVTANSGSDTVSILLGNGTGGFAAATSAAVTGTSPQAIILGYFDGDQILDFVTANATSTANNVTSRLGLAAGGFSLTSGGLASLRKPTDLVAGDFNRDGKLDIVAANSEVGTVRLGLGDGNGGFLPSTAPAVGTAAASDRSIAAGDFNLDGFLDLAVTNVADGNVSVLLGDGDGGFATKADFTVGANPTNISVADVNKDGLPDLLTTNQAGNAIVIRLNQCQ